MIVDNAYPNDIRVRKQAVSLVEAGKKVLVVCPRSKSNVKKEIINGVKIHRVGSNYTDIKKGIYDIIESFTGVNLLFFFGLKEVLKEYELDFLHVHDLPLAGTGYLFRHRIKRKIFLDLHENYPEALRVWFLWKNNPILKIKNWVFMNPYVWSRKEKNYCKKFDGVICVVDEMKHNLIVNYKIDQEKIFVVSNQETKDFAANGERWQAQEYIDKKAFSITYIGGFGPHRGLQTAIEAMNSINKKIPKAKLYLIGKGSKDVENRIRNLIRTLDLDRCVKLIGQVPFEEVFGIMKRSDVNIIPHFSNPHTNCTVPHKLFQIMMSKSLILVSSCKPLKRIVQKYKAGIVFKANDVDDFVRKVLGIYSNPSSYSDYKLNAFNAAIEIENWENESLKLLEIYNSHSE